MKRSILGLDINDEYVAAVVVGMRGQDKVITGSGFVQFDDRDGPAEVLPSLLEKVGWKEGTCVCGISLSGVSLRNLTIPFTEKRKIAQILPLELEDQLVRSVGEQLVEYSVTGTDGNQSHLLVAGLEKERLGRDLDLLDNIGLRPSAITLRTFALAEELMRGRDLSEGFLLVAADLHALTMAIADGGQIVFARRLAYPDRYFTELPFVFDDDGPRVAHHGEAMECVSLLCDSIKQSTGLYQVESGGKPLPGNIVLAGGMAGVAEFHEKMEFEFGQAVIIGNLKQQSGVTCNDDVRDGWDPGFADHALALALQGFRRKISYNFRKDEFAPPKLLFASRVQLVAASGLVVVLLAGIFAYLGFDYRTLNARYTELGDKMEGLFSETFPESTKIFDPLVQMKSKLRDVQAPSIATPIFSGDKRTLAILADISARIPVSIKIHVARLVIDKESVVIKGTTDTFNNVNLIQGVLQKSPTYNDVDIVSAAADKDSGLIRFELKLSTGGAS